MPRSENLTILLSDIVGFTERTARQSRSETDRLLRDHSDLLPPLAARFSGRVIKSMGDAFLITFRSPTDAVRCAMAFQDAVTEFNRSRTPNQQFHIRIALNVGEVRIADGDIHGEAVNVTARVEEFTPADEIYFTEALYLVMNRVEVHAELVGERTLRGIPEPVQVYRVLPRSADSEGNDEFTYGGMHHLQPSSNARNPRRNLPLLVTLAVVAVLIAGGVGWWLAGGRSWDRVAERGETLPLAGTDTPLESATSEQPSANAADLPPAIAEPVIQEPPNKPVQPPPPSKLDLARQAINAGETDEAERLLSEFLDREADPAEALLLSGHLAFERNNRATGVAFYRRALAADSSYKENEELAANLVGALGWVSKPAGDVLLRYPSEPVLSALGTRTNQPGIHGRHQAIALLEAMGHANRIDRLGNAMLDLAEEPECLQRRDAVKRLQRLADKRALPALREAVALQKSNLRNACLFIDAKAAISSIEGVYATDKKNRP